MPSVKHKILCVHRNPEMLRYLEVCCRTHGEYLAVSSGTEALELIQDHDIDILLTDVFVGRISGYELCETLRSSERESWQKLPVILTSSQRSLEFREKGLKAGATVILPQPFSPQDLRNMIDQILNKQLSA